MKIDHLQVNAFMTRQRLANEASAMLESVGLPGVSVRTIHVWRTPPNVIFPAPIGLGAGIHYGALHLGACIAIRKLQSCGYRGWQIKKILDAAYADKDPIGRIQRIIDKPDKEAVCAECGQPLPGNHLRGRK